MLAYVPLSHIYTHFTWVNISEVELLGHGYTHNLSLGGTAK